jgi:hypothetical protein
MYSEEGQLNVFKDKGSCLKSRETVIGNILATNKGAEKCVELKVMHSSQLASIEVNIALVRESKGANK